MVTLRVLLLEDDPLINRAWSLGLNRAGYDVLPLTTLAAAKEILKTQRQFDVAIVDVNLGDGNGLDLLRWMKTEQIAMKTLVVTARQDEETAITALQRGATEFIRKPIGPNELTTRLDRIFRYTNEEAVAAVHLKDLTLNESTREVFCGGQLLKLSPSEFRIFHVLLRQVSQPVSRERLLEVLEIGADASDRTIDSHVSRIRKKLKEIGPHPYSIEPVWGNGYSLVYSE